MQRSFRTIHVGWLAPLAAAHGAAPVDRELTLVTLTDEAGIVGHGEVAAELCGYRGFDAATAEQAGLDAARWDLEGRRAGVPVWRLLGAGEAPAVEVNATIGAEAPERAAEEAAIAARDGFRTVKVKVGVGDDHRRVAAVRTAVGPEVAIRLDANGAWEVERAITALRALTDLGIELCEEPVHGAAGLAAVAGAVPEIAIAADESAGEALAAASAVCAAVCLKVARGGITALLDDAARARSAGYEVYLSSTLDGPLGIAAALHAAAVVRPDRPCGLATLDRFDRESPIAVSGGLISAPAGAGLGDGLLDWYQR